MARYTKPDFAAKESVTVGTVNKWIYRHGLPVIQIGRRTYIDDEDFQAWLTDHKKVISQPQPVKSTEIALPRQCRNRESGFLSKLRPAR
jgi:excisionase family DNA binding protein